MTESADYIYVQTSARKFTRISRKRYALVARVMLSVLERRSRLTIIELIEEISGQLRDFNDNLPWYILRIKDDLASRKIIECKIGAGPLRHQIIEKRRGKIV